MTMTTYDDVISALRQIRSVLETEVLAELDDLTAAMDYPNSIRVDLPTALRLLDAQAKAQALHSIIDAAISQQAHWRTVDNPLQNDQLAP